MFSYVNIQGLNTKGSRSNFACASILVLLLSKLTYVLTFLHLCNLVLLSIRKFSFSKNVATFFWRVIFLEYTPLHLNFCLSIKICESGVLFDDVSDGLLPFSDLLSHLAKFFASSSIV